jgi:hypothetical protein
MSSATAPEVAKNDTKPLNVSSRPKDVKLTMSGADNMETSAASQSMQAMLAKAKANLAKEMALQEAAAAIQPMQA